MAKKTKKKVEMTQEELNERLHYLRDDESEQVSVLIKQGADPHWRCSMGWTALHAAAFTGKFWVVKALVEAGVDVNVRDNYGKTPLRNVLEQLADKTTGIGRRQEIV